MEYSDRGAVNSTFDEDVVPLTDTNVLDTRIHGYICTNVLVNVLGHIHVLEVCGKYVQIRFLISSNSL